jgi:PPOX class probable F420-dependent enzyme
MTDGSMTRAERDTFIREVHVAIIAIDEPGRAPFAMPIWYLVDDDGTIVVSTDGSSLKAKLLAAAGRATLTVQTETAPYRYVSIEGPATIGPVTHDSLALASRYLGDELGRWYADNNPPTEDSVTVRITPEHWRTYDYAKVL